MNCFLELDCFRVSSAWSCRIGRHFLPLIPILLLSPLTTFSRLFLRSAGDLDLLRYPNLLDFRIVLDKVLMTKHGRGRGE